MDIINNYTLGKRPKSKEFQILKYVVVRLNYDLVGYAFGIYSKKKKIIYGPKITTSQFLSERISTSYDTSTINHIRQTSKKLSGNIVRKKWNCYEYINKCTQKKIWYNRVLGV